MTEEEARKRLEESPLNKLQEPAPKAGPSNEINEPEIEFIPFTEEHY